MEIEAMKQIIGIADIAVVNEKAYLSNRFYNALIVCNIKRNIIEHIEQFIHMDASSFAYHKECIEYKGIIYFCPDSGCGVHVYDSNNGCQDYFDIGNSGIVNYSCIIKGQLFLFPWYSEQGLTIVDLEKRKIKTNIQWWNASKILGDEKIQFLISGEYDSSKVWSQCTKTNYLLISDCCEHRIEKYIIGKENRPLRGAQYDGKDFWFTAIDDATIYQWNIKDGIRNIYRPDFVCWKKTYEFSPYRKIVSTQEYLFIIPYEENALFLLNKKTKEIQLLSKFPEWIIYPKIKYWNVKDKIYENHLYLFCDVTNMIIQVNLIDLKVQYISTLIINNKKFEKYKEKIWKSINWEFNKSDYWNENGYDWKTYLPFFINRDYRMQRNINEELCYRENIGNIIYKKLLYL